MAIPLSGKKGKYAQRNEQWRDASQHIAGTGLLKIGFASSSVERLGLPRPTALKSSPLRGRVCSDPRRTALKSSSLSGRLCSDPRQFQFQFQFQLKMAS